MVAVVSAFVREPTLKEMMLKMPGYEVVTFQRKPGLWRASVTPTAPPGVPKHRNEMLSFVTSEDCASELEAEKAASRAIKNLSR
jgi:hypothetical protein